ncbi:hypothetical protein FBUS_06690 [Fasciolopsis buskii]|uniref:CUB domain-containing protein n=1 Tax=Fasciolopsis buskii TaxID=27845 RepID=A0A8E0RY10_9TREM|nr:hypothetical protein FBUS_06690 [Fasciolopsis buski]
MLTSVHSCILVILVVSTVRAQRCNETTEISTPMNITRPVAGERSSVPCILTFIAPNDQRLKFSFMNLSNMISNSTNCSENSIKFADTANGLRNATLYCEKNSPPVSFISNGSSSYIQYQVRQNDTSNFTVQVTNVDPRQPCGSFPVQFSGTSSAFEFPAQNHTVEVGTECIYKTSTTPGSNLTVIIDQIRLGPNGSCTNDYVLFGSDSGFNLTTSYKKCGNETPNDNYTTIGNTLYWRVKVMNLTTQPYLRATIKSGKL